jgi:integrase
MSCLDERLGEYLRMRRALGYGLRRQEKLLRQFLGFLEGRGETRVTTASALAWARLPAGGESWRSYRLTAVRGFARYLDSIGEPVEVPAGDLLPDRPHRAVPYHYRDEQIEALMTAADTLGTAHRTATLRTLIGLLWTTGMRVGEAIALDCADFDDRHGVLIVGHGKLAKSRELPLHESTAAAVRGYLARGDRPRGPAGETALLSSMAGTRLLISNVWAAFATLRSRAGIEPCSPRCRPRIHDMRHSFALRTILDGYRAGEDIGPRLALLSTYLGHVDPKATYWYLEAAPELMQAVGERLERYLEGLR